MKHLKEYFEMDGNYKINLILASFTLFSVIWLSTGTLSPYALSAPDDLILNQYSSFNKDPYINDTVLPNGKNSFQCRYIVNIDHGHFLATFLMLDGADKNIWQGSVVLRRILYPVIAYPFMKLMGFETGGIVANFFLYLITFLIFIAFIKREIGREAAIFTAWAVASFPGVAYFGGLPYSYAFIIPGCLMMAMLLWNLAKTIQLKSIFLLSLGIGIVSLGYDFLPIFGLATILILLRNKLYYGTLISILAMMAPTILFNLILKYYYGVNLTNGNTEMYKIIAFSYLGVFHDLFSGVLGISPDSSTGVFLNENSPFPDLARWFDYLKHFPVYFLFNYVFSTFGFLSIVFTLVNLPKLFGKRLKLSSLEFSVLLAIFFIFAFNNLAPPYRSWQFREYGFARLYEPIFIVMILYLARKIQTLDELPIIKQRILLIMISVMIIGNAITSFSTILPNNLGLGIYGNFYLQSYTTKQTYSDFKERIKKYGRSPIGFCGSPKGGNTP